MPKKKTNWLLIILIVVGGYLLMTGFNPLKGFIGATVCTSNEPTTVEELANELSKWKIELSENEVLFNTENANIESTGIINGIECSGCSLLQEEEYKNKIFIDWGISYTILIQKTPYSTNDYSVDSCTQYLTENLANGNLDLFVYTIKNGRTIYKFYPTGHESTYWFAFCDKNNKNVIIMPNGLPSYTSNTVDEYFEQFFTCVEEPEEICEPDNIDSLATEISKLIGPLDCGGEIAPSSETEGVGRTVIWCSDSDVFTNIYDVQKLKEIYPDEFTTCQDTANQFKIEKPGIESWCSKNNKFLIESYPGLENTYLNTFVICQQYECQTASDCGDPDDYNCINGVCKKKSTGGFGCLK